MKTSLILMVITIIAKFFGLARETALAHFFGASVAADIFLIAFQIPMTFTNVISGAIANGYIPIYDSIKSMRSEREARNFTANLTNILGLLAIIISVVGIIFATPIVKLLAEGFEGEILQRTVFFSRIAMISIFATATASVFKSMLQIYSKFVVSVIHAIIMNFIIILFMAISKKYGLNLLAYGIAVAFIFQYIVFIPAIRKTGYRHKFFIDKSDPDVKKLIRVILPIFISTSVIELNFIISRSIASGLFEGAISTLNYAYKLQSFVTGIVVTSIITATYPKMARFASMGDNLKLKKQTEDAISNMALLVFPSAVGLLVLSEPIVNLLFVRGAFTREDGIITASVLSFYALGVIGIGVREILSRVFYSTHDTYTPVINSVIMVALNVVLSLILSKIMGVKGLALATTISFIAGAIILFFQTRPKIGRLFQTGYMNMLKIVLASASMGVFAKFLFGFLKFSNNISLIVTIALSAMIYGALLLLLKEDEIYKLIKKILKK